MSSSGEIALGRRELIAELIQAAGVENEGTMSGEAAAELSFEEFGDPSATDVTVEGRVEPAAPMTAQGELGFDRPDALGGYRFWSADYYRTYFNVDTKDVLMRMLCALWPFRKSFFAETKKNPDLYGPFWISTTLVFVMAVTSNYYGYLMYLGLIRSNHEPDSTESSAERQRTLLMLDPWQYDFTKMTFAAGIVYSYVILWPACLAIALRFGQVGVGILQVICIYGYGMVLFIPASALCAIPSEIAGWAFVIIAWSSSSVFLLLNFWHLMRRKMPKRYLLALLVIEAVHLVVSVAFKLYFFEYDPRAALNKLKDKL